MILFSNITPWSLSSNFFPVHFASSPYNCILQSACPSFLIFSDEIHESNIINDILLASLFTYFIRLAIILNVLFFAQRGLFFCRAIFLLFADLCGPINNSVSVFIISTADDDCRKHTERSD